MKHLPIQTGFLNEKSGGGVFHFHHIAGNRYLINHAFPMNFSNLIYRVSLCINPDHDFAIHIDPVWLHHNPGGVSVLVK